MKNFIALGALLALTACGQPRVLGGTEYPTYGIANSNSQKSSKVCYELSLGNTVWSVLLIETVVMPIYFVGWSLFNPVALRNADGTCPNNIDNR